MSRGRFIAVVGPSGVGKDSLIEALCLRIPDLTRVKRVITRAREAGGEDYEPVGFDAFERRAERDDFILHWQAHELSYGIPRTACDTLRQGHDIIANLSRSVLADAAVRLAPMHVLAVFADPLVLAQRLADRGRESPEQIARRIARNAPPMPHDLRISEIDNSGGLDASVASALSALYPERV